jgi:beta-phosphoglucomutase-like phosphatase (HAD superfamily)
MKITTFLFDLDGVLVDLCDLHRTIFIKACDGLIDLDFHNKYLEGLSTKEKLKIIENHLCIKIDKEFIYKKKQELTLISLQTYEFNDRIRYVLEWVKQQNIRIGVYTNSIRSTLDLVLDKLGITNLIEYSLSNEDVIEQKPSSFGYIKLMNMMNVMTTETIIFEDSFYGKTSA